MTLRIGDRVRLLCTPFKGTVFAVPYEFRGDTRVGVVWDDMPKLHDSVSVGLLASAEPRPPTVPPEARPLSVGAMAGGGR